MNDIYSKVVMTVIAVALTVIAGNQLFGQAQAQGDGCGSYSAPCTVEIKTGLMGGLPVSVTNWPYR